MAAIESFYIGRILEICNDTQIRIAWFYRLKDVHASNKKKSADPRMLIASMNSDLNP